MIDKPKHLGPEYAAQFMDKSVAEAYPHRPPYTIETFEILLNYIPEGPRIVLDLGCGTGDVARRIAGEVDRVDAVDPSLPLITVGRSMPGADDWRLRWIQSTAEDFHYADTYGLICAAESFQWMDWEVVLKKIGQALKPSGKFLLLQRKTDEQPWKDEVCELVSRYSTNQDYKPYDLTSELIARNLVEFHFETPTPEMVHTQSIHSYIESYHSKNGFSRQRMGLEAASRFDQEMREILKPHAYNGYLEYVIYTHITGLNPL